MFINLHQQVTTILSIMHVTPFYSASTNFKRLIIKTALTSLHPENTSFVEQFTSVLPHVRIEDVLFGNSVNT